jgi:hypothetical protein
MEHMKFMKAQQAKSGSSNALMMAAIVTITCAYSLHGAESFLIS